jgi:multidrug efflux pump subunit AcrA (membrane-fusion protein)
VGNLKKDQEVEIVLDALPDDTIRGKIEFIGLTPRGDEIGAVYKVKVRFEEGNLDIQKYRIGMSGDVKFILSQESDVLFVPPKFIKSDTNGKYVKKNAKNGKTYIETGLEGEDRVEIKGDIKEGDIIYD